MTIILVTFVLFVLFVGWFGFFSGGWVVFDEFFVMVCLFVCLSVVLGCGFFIVVCWGFFFGGGGLWGGVYKKTQKKNKTRGDNHITKD